MNTPESPLTLSQQIARLQQRQLELIKQTSEELELLKKQVDASDLDDRKVKQERERLLAEVELLQEQNQAKDKQLDHLESWFTDYQRQVRDLFVAGDSLLSQTPSFEGMAPVAEKSKKKQKEAPAITSTIKQVESKPVKERIQKTRKPIAISKGARRLAVRFAVLSLLIGGGYAGWQRLGVPSQPIVPESGKVAGASTISSIANSPGTPVAEDYAQSFADVSFADTKWSTTTDSDFGLSMEFPENATNRIHTVGGNNLWFLRKSGYLLKVSRMTSVSDTLDTWVEANKETYAESKVYNLTKTTFKNQPAWMAQPTVHTTTSGYQYFLKRGTTIYTLWIKEEAPTTDDGQRLARMITSIQFTN